MPLSFTEDLCYPHSHFERVQNSMYFGYFLRLLLLNPVVRCVLNLATVFRIGNLLDDVQFSYCLDAVRVSKKLVWRRRQGAKRIEISSADEKKWFSRVKLWKGFIIPWWYDVREWCVIMLLRRMTFDYHVFHFYLNVSIIMFLSTAGKLPFRVSIRSCYYMEEITITFTFPSNATRVSNDIIRKSFQKRKWLKRDKILSFLRSKWFPCTKLWKMDHDVIINSFDVTSSGIYAARSHVIFFCSEVGIDSATPQILDFVLTDIFLIFSGRH